MLVRTSAGGGLAIALAATAWLLGRPPAAGCETPRGGTVHEIAASRIVVRPWLGPHQVYGIFVVPDRFMDPRYSARLAVAGFESAIIRNLVRKRSYVDPALARPGHYLERAYVPTRVALRLLLTGHFGELRTACHWQLGFYEPAI